MPRRQKHLGLIGGAQVAAKAGTTATGWWTQTHCSALQSQAALAGGLTASSAAVKIETVKIVLITSESSLLEIWLNYQILFALLTNAA